MAYSLISDKIIKGKNITMKFNKEWQKNVEDLVAKRISSQLCEIVLKYNDEYLAIIPKDYITLTTSVLGSFKDWTGAMLAKKERPLIYSLWTSKLYSMMLHKQFPEKYERKSIVSSFVSDYFLGNMVSNWTKGNSLDSPYCENKRNINNTKKCIYNVIYSLLKALQLIRSKCGVQEVKLDII